MSIEAMKVNATCIKALLLAALFVATETRTTQAQESCANLQHQLRILRGSGGAGSQWEAFAIRRMHELGCFGRKRAAPACKKGFYVSGGKCVREGQKRCGNENRSCPKDLKCIPGGCAPKDASVCPGGKGNFCKTPNLCATGLDGKDACFTEQGLRTLKAEIERREHEKLVKARATRVEATQEIFRKRYGKPYAEWLETVRSLADLLSKIPADQEKQREQARADLQEAFAPQQSGTLPEIAAGGGTELPSAGGAAEDCEQIFELSELWDEGFNLDHCTRQGWAIANREKSDLDLPGCVVLHPDGTLLISLKQSKMLNDRKQSPHYTGEITFTDLKADSWLLGRNDSAALRILVDNKVMHDQTERVGVSDKPPLRYSFSRSIEGADLESLAAGMTAVAQIADKTWDMSLRGSAQAIKAVQFCAAEMQASAGS